MYTSREIQNTLLDIMGGMVQWKVCMVVKNAGYFFVLADETKDISKSEQLVIVLRREIFNLCSCIIFLMLRIYQYIF